MMAKKPELTAVCMGVTMRSTTGEFIPREKMDMKEFNDIVHKRISEIAEQIINSGKRK